MDFVFPNETHVTWSAMIVGCYSLYTCTTQLSWMLV